MPRNSVATNGTTLSVIDEGSGPAVVLLHGVLMSGRCFENQLELAANHRIVIPDIRGHGESEKPLDGHTVPNYARDLHETLERLGVTRPVLVGWSMGAMVLYEYLQGFGSDDVAGIVIVDQVPTDFSWDDGYEFGLFTLQSLLEIVAGLQTNQRTLSREFAELMLHEPTEEKIEFLTNEMMLVPPAIASTIVVDQTLRDYRSFLPKIDVPTLVAFGTDNKLTPPAGEWIASQIPGAELQYFDAGHALFFERASAFNQAIADFVRAL